LQAEGQPDRESEKLARPKFTPPKAAVVLRTAHFASLIRDGSQPQEFGVAPVGHIVGQTVGGVVHADMLPEVSTTTMK
jgi:hypothetical protein